MPTKSKFLTVSDLRSTFFSIPTDNANQYLFAFIWEGQQYTWTVMTQDFTKSPSYISQISKADLDDIKCSGGSTLLQYVDGLLLCSPSQVFFQEDSTHLLKLLASKGHTVSKEKRLFVQTQVHYFGHLIVEKGLGT